MRRGCFFGVVLVQIEWRRVLCVCGIALNGVEWDGKCALLHSACEQRMGRLHA